MRGGSTNGDESGDVDELLAATVGMSIRAFVSLLGAGWRPAEIRDHSEPSWNMSGMPPQLMLAVDGEIVILARPVGRWYGLHELGYEPLDEHRFSVTDLHDAEEVRAVVGLLLRRRRSSFRYCSYCRAVTGPEHRIDDRTCMACASKWLGVVY